jgi:hypothetical protein
VATTLRPANAGLAIDNVNNSARNILCMSDPPKSAKPEPTKQKSKAMERGSNLIKRIYTDKPTHKKGF